MLKNSFLLWLEKALNRYLNLDPETNQRLHTLEGKVVRIDLKSLQLQFDLHFSNQHIKLSTIQTDTPDTTIIGTPLQLMGVMLNKENRVQFFAKDVQITGDLMVGQQIIQLFDALDIDWEEQLSKLVGDNAAHQLGKAKRKLSTWLEQINQSLTVQTKEYIQEEVAICPTREELNDFYAEIDALRMDVDRLEAKIKLFTAKSTSKHKH